MQPAEPDEVSPTGAPPGDMERVSVLVGDRLCTGCPYNLTGQPVVREPHYDLLVVRCPECGTVAGVQEYPMLGRWAGRWAALLAGLWFIVMLGLAIGSAAMMFALSIATSEAAGRTYRDHLDELHEAWLAELHPGEDVSARWNFEPFGDFWVTVEPAEVLAGAGGWFAAVDWIAAGLWIVIGLLAAAFGVFWSTALLHLRRRGLLLFGLLLLTVPSAIGIAGNLTDITGRDVDWSNEASWYQVGLPFMAMTLTVALIGVWSGMLVGRRVVRALVRLLLPPRLRGALAMLWTAEGLPPPTTRA